MYVGHVSPHYDYVYRMYYLILHLDYLTSLLVVFAPMRQCRLNSMLSDELSCPGQCHEQTIVQD